MSYLSQPTSKTNYGVTQVGGNINVLDGVISVPQDLNTNASVTFSNVTVTGNLVLNGNTTVTSVTPSAGPGIGLSNVVTYGPDAKFTIENTGVLSLYAGNGISLSSNTGNITISSFGADLINVYGTTTNYTATALDEYIGVYSAAAVTISLPAGITGRVYTIKDEYGQGSGKITIQSLVGDKIDNASSYIISVPYQSISIVFRAGQWRII